MSERPGIRPEIIEPLRDITYDSLGADGYKIWKDDEIERRQALRETGQITSESVDEEMAYAGDELRRDVIVKTLGAEKDFSRGGFDTIIA